MEPAAQIFELSEGFMLVTAQGHSIACTNLQSLNRAVAKTFGPGRDNVTPLPQRPTPDQVRQALSPAPVAPPQGQVPVQGRVVPAPNPALVQSLRDLPTDQAANLNKLADAVYRGLVQTADIRPNLEAYVPSLSPEQWNLFISEYVADRRGMDDDA